MKKTLFVILILAAFMLQSQTGTLFNTYTVPNMVAGGMMPKSHLINNRLYTVYWEPQGLSLQKNDLDGTPLLKKQLTNLTPSGSNGCFLNSLGAVLYISGTRSVPTGSTSATIPFLVAVDTTSLNLIFASQYSLNPSWSNTKINDVKLLNNNYLLYVGSVTNFGGANPEYGFVLGLNTSGNGMPAYSGTLASGGSTLNMVNSVTEVSNSSVIFTMFGAGNILGRGIKTNNSFSVQALCSTPVGGAKVDKFSAKRLFAYSNSQVYKIDTNLTPMISNTVAGVVFANAATATMYDNGRLYRISSNTSKLEIVDSSLNFAGIHTYSSVAQFPANFPQSIGVNNSHLFLSYSQNSTTNNFYLLKTDLSGNMNCAQQQSASTTPTSSIASPMNPLSGSISVTQSFITLPVANVGVTVSTGCLPTSMKKVAAEDLFRLAYDNGVYRISSGNALSEARLYDMSGKLIQILPAEGLYTFPVDLRSLPSGVYIADLRDRSGHEKRLKLIN